MKLVLRCTYLHPWSHILLLFPLEPLLKPLNSFLNFFHTFVSSYSEAPRTSTRGICGKAKRNCAEANPTSPCGVRRGRLSPFLPVLPHGASWRRRVNARAYHLTHNTIEFYTFDAT
jgi:hypothetical protein